MPEPNRFVVQWHHATNFHRDFRLEIDGVLKSWAVPKGLPSKPGIKRLAIQVDDHALAYLNYEHFEPDDGRGTVKIEDIGKYTMLSVLPEALIFELHGHVFQGRYVLRKFHDGDKNWLLFKVNEGI